MANSRFKFRAWDKTRGYMERFSGQKVGIEYAFGEFNVSTGYDSYDSPTYGEPKEDWVIQQFTGLHDRNGVEIYEGDIIRLTTVKPRWPDDEEAPTVKRIMKIDFHSGAFWMSGGGLSTCLHFHYNDDSREVIGNIYQHPHLLEDTSNE